MMPSTVKLAATIAVGALALGGILATIGLRDDPFFGGLWTSWQAGAILAAALWLIVMPTVLLIDRRKRPPDK